MIAPISRAVLPTLGLFALTACAGLGSVPDELIQAYDQASPDSVIEVEIDRDGTVHAIEAGVPVEAVPVALRERALEMAPGATITGAEREYMAGATGWEVKLRHEGRNWEIVMNEDGEVIETERELRDSEVPTAVLEAADRAMSRGTRSSVEIIESGEHAEYHVKKKDGQVSYKAVITPDGEIVRVVREHRAELEIPLR
jgi:hypothetical protein